MLISKQSALPKIFLEFQYELHYYILSVMIESFLNAKQTNFILNFERNSCMDLPMIVYFNEEHEIMYLLILSENRSS